MQISEMVQTFGAGVTGIIAVLWLVFKIVQAKRGATIPPPTMAPSAEAIAAVVRDQAERQEVLEGLRALAEMSARGVETLDRLARAEERQTEILADLHGGQVDIRTTQAHHTEKLDIIHSAIREASPANAIPGVPADTSTM